MKALECQTVARLLQPYHDRELPATDEIAVGSHVESCVQCAAALDDLREVSAAFAELAPTHAVISNEEANTFTATVVSRLKAENDASLLSHIRHMFDDIRLVYAGLGAVSASVVCVMVMLGMMRYATNERPDSLAAIVTLVATPLECEATNDAGDAAGCRARWQARFHRANESAQQDSVFELDSAVIHQSGRLADLERLRGHRAAVSQARSIEALLDSVNRLRLEGTRPSSPPVPGSVLWLLEHATVRATPIKPPIGQMTPPPLKKRADSGVITARVARA